MEKINTSSLEPITHTWSTQLCAILQLIDAIQDKDERLGIKVAFHNLRKTLDLMMDIKHSKKRASEAQLPIKSMLDQFEKHKRSNTPSTSSTFDERDARDMSGMSGMTDMTDMTCMTGIPDESIGQEICKFIHKIGTGIDVRIENAIHLLQDGYLSISQIDLCEAIRLLNIHIVSRNMQLSDHELKHSKARGIIIQIRPRKYDNSSIRDMMRFYMIICRTCGHMDGCKGCIDLTIIAPPFCSKCKRANLLEVSYSRRHSISNIDDTSANKCTSFMHHLFGGLAFPLMKTQ